MKLRQSQPAGYGSDSLLFNHSTKFHTILSNVTTVLLLYCCCFIVDNLIFCLDFCNNNVNKTIILPSELDRYDIYDYYRKRHKLLLQKILKLRLILPLYDNRQTTTLLNFSSIKQRRCLLNVQIMKFKNYLIHCHNNNNDTSTRHKMRTCFGVPYNNRLRKVLLMAIMMMWSLPSVSSHEPQLNHSPNVIKTKYGLLRGVVLKNEPLVEGYLGIPYGEFE